MATEEKPLRAVAFRVPNNKRGQRFLREAREYVNRERFSAINARPRGGTRDSWGDYARDGCKWFGVYFRESERQRAEDRGHLIRNYVGRFDHERMIREYEGQAERNRERLDARYNGLQAEYLKRGGKLRDTARAVEHWQIATLAAFIVGAVIGYFAG